MSDPPRIPDAKTRTKISKAGRDSNSFRLHPGTASRGCLTVSSGTNRAGEYILSEEYKMLEKMLNAEMGSNILEVTQ